MHLESTRFDMLREDVMPNTCACPGRACRRSTTTVRRTIRAAACSVCSTGLPASYYALARRDGAKPLPLQILKKLGYSLSAYYSSYLATYEGLCDLFFKGVVDHVDEERDPHADRADAAMIDHYVATWPGRSAAAKVRHVVIESSHYDYAIRRHSRGSRRRDTRCGIRDGITNRPGINDELKPPVRAVRNRYQNSILWADTLGQRVVDAWAARRDEVILVITGDHGEAFWEHGTFGHCCRS